VDWVPAALTRRALIVVLAGALAGCTTILLRGRPTAIDELAQARVRIYHLGPRTCRAEIITATETTTIGVALCEVVPHRTR